MWDDLKRHLRAFPNGVLTAHDADGYPASVRTAIEADDVRSELLLHVQAGLGLQPGPASLLFHDHDAHLSNQHVLLVRGELTTTPAGWVFYPHKLVPTMGYGGGLGLVRAIVRCRKTARAYLRKRGLARPPIPWERFRALAVREAHQ